MIRAGVVSFLIVSIGYSSSKGYDLLLSMVDAHVSQTYQLLNAQPQPELRDAAQDIRSNYQTVRSQYD